MSRLSLMLFGGFRAEVDGRPIALPKKARALLAYLALSPGPHSRTRLAALLWGASGDEQARNSLRQALYLIRRALAERRLDLLGHDADTVTLDLRALDVDALAFCRLAAQGSDDACASAVELYRGPLLEGASVDEPPFETWLAAERSRLHEQALTLLRAILARRLASPAPDEAIDVAVRLLALDPLQETAHRALMRLYAGQGRRADALRQFRGCAELLRRELGVEPEPQTRTLYHELLASPAPPAVARGSSAASSRGGALPLCPVIGRDPELSILTDAVKRARDGGAHLVTLVGEAGIGKSRLLEEITARAEQAGLTAIRGRAYETERILPFGVWTGALRSFGIDADHPAVQALAPTWRTELARLMPEVMPRGRPGAVGSASYLRLFEAVAQLLLSLASARPVLVALEDLHWADDTTVRLLAFLGRRLQAAPVCVVTTARLEELAPGTVLRGALDELQRDGRLTELALAPLAEAATGELVRALVGGDRSVPRDLAREVWRLSTGHPLTVVEAVKTFAAGPGPGGSGVAEIPERVRQLVLEQLGRLDERARALASVAAVIGRRFDFEILRQAAGLDETAALEALDALLQRRILNQTGATLDFSHDRIREVVYGELSVPRRRRAHGQVAAAIEAQHAGDLAPHYGILAVHYREGQVWDRALEFLRAAAAQAAARGVYREAVALFEQALQAGAHLGDDRDARAQAVEIRVELRDLLHTLAEPARAVEHLAHADRLVRALGDDRRRAIVLNKLAHQAWLDGQHARAAALGSELVAAGRALGDGRLEGSGHLRVGQAAHALGDHEVAIDALGSAAKILEGGPAYGIVFGIASLVADMWRTGSLADLGRFDEAVALARRTLAMAEAADHLYSIAYAHLWLGRVHLDRYDLERALPALERSHELVHRWGIADLAPGTAATLGHAWVLAGRAHDGLRLLEPLTLNPKGNSVGRQARKAEAYAAAGRRADARAIADAALAMARQLGERGNEALLLRILGDLLAAAEPVGAADCYGRGLALAEALGLRPVAEQCRRGLGTEGRSAQHPPAARVR
jgi:DNA-binding SARP family transcriptional activator